MQKYFFIGDKVLYAAYPADIEGTVTKANPEFFEVKWKDGCFSTENQIQPTNISKVEE